MRLWRWSAGAMLGAAALLVAGCGLLSPSESYRYRVTVEVQTPQGMRSGSSVWKVVSKEGSGIPDTAIRSRVTGEAVTVDLPSGPMFVLLRGQDMNVDYASNIVYRHLLKHPHPAAALKRAWSSNQWSSNMRIIAESGAAFELYPDEYPLLVRFRDIDDPASVAEVDPANLAASFGQGVRLQRITISVTDDQVTRGISDRLPWLSKHPEPRLEPNYRGSVSPTLVQRLSHGDFAKN